MSSRLLILACLSIQLAGCGLLNIISRQTCLHSYIVRPSMISPGLAPLDVENPPLLGDKALVLVAGNERYDAFFRDAAVVCATVALSDTLTNQFGQALVEASTGAFLVPRTDPEQWGPIIQKLFSEGGDLPQLVDLGKHLQTLLPELAALPGRSTGLLSDAKSLTALAQDVYSQDKKQLICVTTGLENSVSQLETAGKSIGRTARNVETIAAFLATTNAPSHQD